jgi:tRNA-uridine 2-sulfurtransferase
MFRGAFCAPQAGRCEGRCCYSLRWCLRGDTEGRLLNRDDAPCDRPVMTSTPPMLPLNPLTPRSRASGGPRRIVVAMSGGVDSSVAAALLKAEGHDVIGITLQLYDHGVATKKKGACCAGQDIHDARRVADALSIPYYVLDYERRFEAAVMQSFADSYLAGETPIPCVACNSQIKFKELLDTARDLGADALATGHYIQRVDGPDGPELRRALDPERDQSYFLFATTRAQLKDLWFPLGGLPKARVRELAAELKLPVAAKPDSQDICFVPSGRYADVIQRLRPDAVEGGDIVHIDGRILGQHDGIINFTVGQRRGLKIPGPNTLFVVRLDARNRRVFVGPRDALRTVGLSLRDVNWIGAPSLDPGPAMGPEQADAAPIELFVRMRSSQAPQAATLTMRPGGSAEVILHGGEHGIASGQACVFYASGEPEARVLGGGFISRAHMPDAVAKSAMDNMSDGAGPSNAASSVLMSDVQRYLR